MPKKLEELAKLFPQDAPLYVVGGFVRDSLLGLEPFDIDICSKLPPRDVCSILENTNFKVLDSNLRVGTIIIKNEEFKAEFTTFRKDSYKKNSGCHSPEKIEFVENIEDDAKRRDFKVNAIYFDIKNKNLIDPLLGVEDLKNNTLSTVVEPSKVFDEDGLRLLRLVRQASEYGFEIDKTTFDTAKLLCNRLDDISPERIQVEIEKIFVADTKYPQLNLKNAHFRGICLLDDLILLSKIFPELTNLKNLAQRKDYHKYDAFLHSLKAYEFAPPNIRLSALLHDIGKKPCVEKYGNMHGHAEVGAKLAKKRLSALKYSNQKIGDICQLIEIHMFDLKGEAKISTARLFLQKNQNVVREFFELQKADSKASRGDVPYHTLRLEKIWEEMESDGTPLSVKDLKVDGNDLIGLGIENKKRSNALKLLLKHAILDNHLRNRESQLQFLKKL